MPIDPVSALLWFCAVGCGLMAGIYFTFSAFVMASLAKIAPAAGIAAMQSINEVIVRSAFMPLFVGTSLAAVAAAVLALRDLDQPGGIALLTAGVLYVVGMFLCTAVFNVPLNNRLAAIDPASAEGLEVWTQYARVWTRWNHVRTIACTLSGALFMAVLVARA